MVMGYLDLHQELRHGAFREQAGWVRGLAVDGDDLVRGQGELPHGHRGQAEGDGWCDAKAQVPGNGTQDMAMAVVNVAIDDEAYVLNFDVAQEDDYLYGVIIDVKDVTVRMVGAAWTDVRQHGLTSVAGLWCCWMATLGILMMTSHLGQGHRARGRHATRTMKRRMSSDRHLRLRQLKVLLISAWVKTCPTPSTPMSSRQRPSFAVWRQSFECSSPMGTRRLTSS